MRHIAFGSVFVAILVALVFLGFRDSLDQGARASHISGTIDLVAVDMINNTVPGNQEDSNRAAAPVGTCANSGDDDADTRVDAADDPDADLRSSSTEWAYGTDPLSACPLILGHDAWHADFDTNRFINILDVGFVLPPFFGSSSASGFPNYSPRADLSPAGGPPDGFINILDVGFVLPPTFGTSCTTAQ